MATPRARTASLIWHYTVSKTSSRVRHHHVVTIFHIIIKELIRVHVNSALKMWSKPESPYRISRWIHGPFFCTRLPTRGMTYPRRCPGRGIRNEKRRSFRLAVWSRTGWRKMETSNAVWSFVFGPSHEGKEGDSKRMFWEQGSTKNVWAYVGGNNSGLNKITY
jgi:hypothetical protein